MKVPLNHQNSSEISNQLAYIDFYRESTQKFQRWKRWNMEEQLKYNIFVEYHRDKFGKFKKTHSIFKLMAAYIKTKTTLQCKNHHHKYKSQNIDKRLESFKRRCPNFSTFYERQKGNLLAQEEKYMIGIQVEDWQDSKQIQEKKNKQIKDKIKLTKKIQAYFGCIFPLAVQYSQNMSKTNQIQYQYYNKLIKVCYFYNQWKNKVTQLLSGQNISS